MNWFGKITKRIANWPCSTDECWEWKGGKSGISPRMWIDERSRCIRGYLLRLFCQFDGRTRPPRCKNLRCVNPWHNDPFYSEEDRSLRRRSKSPIPYARSRNVCLWEGHSLLGENAMKEGKSSKRRCRLCFYRYQMETQGISHRAAIAQLEKELGIA